MLAHVPSANDMGHPVELLLHGVHMLPGCRSPEHSRSWGEMRVTLTRLELMVWTIIAPEMMILWAMRQWFGACSDDSNSDSDSDSDDESSSDDSVSVDSGRRDATSLASPPFMISNATPSSRQR
ncbi:hypothetical protein BDZ97DRAFT_1409217 [Flammula alnicola]|nr:hypothetical protein BDZ97DRAFT_1409217 [Flammula alnicola]